MVSARIIVNAAGPWVDRVLRGGLAAEDEGRVRLVRGSHIIVRRAFAGDHAWLFQQPDGRIVFAIPYLDDCTLIGTTDVAVDTPEDSRISRGETEYLLAAVNRYRRVPLGEAEIVGDYAGIRALYDDGSADPSKVTRDYRLELDQGAAPLLSVFGGKITTARHLAESALKRLGLRVIDTSHCVLPGGDMADFAAFLSDARRRWPFVEDRLIERLARAYGTRISDLLGDARSAADLGRDFGAGLSEREVDYLVRREWAVTTEDILWRRTKLGYRFSPQHTEALDAYLARKAT